MYVIIWDNGERKSFFTGFSGYPMNCTMEHCFCSDEPRALLYACYYGEDELDAAKKALAVIRDNVYCANGNDLVPSEQFGIYEVSYTKTKED